MSVALPTRSGSYYAPLVLAAVVVLGASDARAADPYQDKVLPFLDTYCVQCHSKQKPSGDLDLTRFTSAAKIVEDFRQWEHVVTFLKKEEMPPAKSKQPSAELRAEMITTLEKVLLAEARKFAGDPGVVPPRRLTNAEYDYTIRDLTGHDIRPAKAFPVDPASGEGFNNTGEALTMSPNLFKKYYAAGERVADHALLTTTGLRFAPHQAVTFADRQKYYERAIIRFYEAHAVDYETYFTALWLYQHRPAAQRATTVEQWAARRGLSPKYSRSLWDALSDQTPDPFVIGWLRQQWTALPAPQNPADPTASEVQPAVRALTAEIQKLSRDLCPRETPPIVADAGNAPIDHLARRRKTADTRDTFDASAKDTPRFASEYRDVTRSTKIRVVVQARGLGAKADGHLIINGTFTTNDPTTDKVKKWSLRSVLAAHAPDQLEKLGFGKHPLGGTLDADAFALAVPAVLELDIPTAAFPLKGRGSVTFSADCTLVGSTAGAALVRVLDRKPAAGDPKGLARPLVDPKNATRYEESGAAFCRLFPSRFFYVDATRGLSAGFHLIEGFFRDDVPLCRSVLSDAEKRELDQLWSELEFATGIWEKMLRGFVFFERSERNFLKHPDFDSFKEEDPDLVKDETLVRFKEVYLKRASVKLTGDDLAKHPISVFFESVRAGLKWQAATLQRAQPIYLNDLLGLAERAYRRPLTDGERRKLETFFTDVCGDKDHGTESAVRASIVRVLVSPHFCMRFDPTPVGESVAPLSDLALASRLSYFIWSGPPDDELLALAKAGKLHNEVVLRDQVRRMVKDPKVSRFALEFFGQWLGYRDFLTQEAVNRQVFPAFDDALKNAMFEEPTRLVTYLIQNDKPITGLLDSDLTFVNKKLAAHYGLPFNGGADEWDRVTGLHAAGRGGVLGMGVFLTKNSQPQRTSPVKRGFWVVHKVLGEHIPPPPPDVAVLPAKETDTNGKTIRQLLKMHVEDAKCARCHQRFDPIGIAMEGFDPIGRSRAKDLAGRPIDNVVALPSGRETRGVPEFGAYLATSRKADFNRTLAHKFLGYALGRSLQLSDQPLLEQMEAELAKDGSKLSAVFELVATSPQFRTQRCKDFSPTKFRTDTIRRPE
ncbi:DUF1592 domain-containing protein [Frigoriglobus tundricola]|uniref:Cytochrome c domain-containing protein n=1 Tax=Frigoriglobus tundricola TaxID=2774151 RepID=A0A6M5Z1F8_9BACT|nr:DUF1592 domain-containing protein [Frigoriglobus tundricola]QJX00180.1 hypothetical protein FTUN_7804 [Frigoriglobus tundricola]